jgi:hypothetical protein
MLEPRCIQRRVYELGQRAQSRIEFEELALRSIDPALGPRVGSSNEGAKMLNVGDNSSITNMVRLLYFIDQCCSLNPLHM